MFLTCSEGRMKHALEPDLAHGLCIPGVEEKECLPFPSGPLPESSESFLIQETVDSCPQALASFPSDEAVASHSILSTAYPLLQIVACCAPRSFGHVFCPKKYKQC